MKYPNDVRQVEDYSRLTRDVIPKLFTTLRETVADQQGEFVLQVGDLVEGLCGTEERAVRKNRDAIAMIRDTQLGVPFLFAKGNHDITGPGAPEAFRSVFHPFIAERCSVLDRGAKTSKACCSFRHAETLFCCFDAYDKESLNVAVHRFSKGKGQEPTGFAHDGLSPQSAWPVRPHCWSDRWRAW